jgi:hypothetical protein
MGPSAVITADIVNFTLLSSVQQRKLLKEIKAIFIDAKIEFYRGDSFQAYCKHPETAYDLILKVRAFSRSMSPEADTRAVIGIGKVKLPVRFLKTAGGEAFILSGRAFESLGTTKRLKIVTGKPDLTLEVMGNYTDFIFERMTSGQAEVIYYLLSGKTQQEVARKLKKAQPTIAGHAKAGGWPEIRQISNQYKSFINEKV